MSSDFCTSIAVIKYFIRRYWHVLSISVPVIILNWGIVIKIGINVLPPDEIETLKFVTSYRWCDQNSVCGNIFGGSDTVTVWGSLLAFRVVTEFREIWSFNWGLSFAQYKAMIWLSEFFADLSEHMTFSWTCIVKNSYNKTNEMQ